MTCSGVPPCSKGWVGAERLPEASWMAIRRILALGVAAALAIDASHPCFAGPAGEAPERLMSASAWLSIVEIGGYDGNISVSPDGRFVAFQLQRANIGARTYDIEWY